MKVKDIIPLWAEEKKKQVKLSSFYTYKLTIRAHILPAFGESEVITEQDVQHWIYNMVESGRMSSKSVHDAAICLKMILRFAKKRGLMEYNGFDLVYPRSEHKEKLSVLSKKDYAKLTEYLFENFTFRNIGILIALHTGMRVGELCAMKWEDIDMDSGVFLVNKTLLRVYINEDAGKKTDIIIDSPKTKNSDREIPVSKKLMTKLKPLKKICNPEYYILTNEKKPTEPRTYRNYFYSVLDVLDIPRIRFHACRHTFATYCIESGADIKTTSVLLGHSNVSITLNTYVHPDINKKRAVIDKIFK